jgi:hypothetical protein
MSKRIRHMGMILTKEEHERWYKKHGELTPEQDDATPLDARVPARVPARQAEAHATLLQITVNLCDALR